MSLNKQEFYDLFNEFKDKGLIFEQNKLYGYYAKDVDNMLLMLLQWNPEQDNISLWGHIYETIDEHFFNDLHKCLIRLLATKVCTKISTIAIEKFLIYLENET